MKTIGKTDLVNAIAASTSTPVATVERVLNGAIEEIGQHAAAGNKVQLRGLGSFQTKTRAARTARNPATGASVQVPEKSVLTFKASR